MDDRHLIETVRDRRVVHRGRYLVLRIDSVEDHLGGRHEREVVEHPGAVAILALADADVLMVRQYRAAVGSVLLEVPAGTLDRDAAGEREEPARAAARELAEETGQRASAWRALGAFYTAPGFTDELMHLFLATGLEPVEGHPGPEPDERLDLVRVPWREAMRMAEAGELRDAKSLVALLRLARLVDAGDVAPPGEA
jgi:ADP-ribose pyrophosphatase